MLAPEEEFPEYDLQETKQLLDASGRQIRYRFTDDNYYVWNILLES